MIVTVFLCVENAPTAIFYGAFSVCDQKMGAWLENPLEFACRIYNVGV